MARLNAAERRAAFLGQLAGAMFDITRAKEPNAVAKRAITAALRKYYRADNVHSVDEVLEVIGHMHENVPSGMPLALRLIVSTAIQEAVIEWLPEDTALRLTALAAFPVIEAEVASLFSKGPVTTEGIMNVIRRSFTSAYTKIVSTINPPATGGTVADTPAPATPAPAPVVPVRQFVMSLAGIQRAMRAILMRLTEFSEQEARPGNDTHKEITGFAGALRDAVVSATTHNSAAAMEALFEAWTPAELVRLGGLVADGRSYVSDPVAFLGDSKVQTLMGVLITDHYGRVGVPIPAAVTDSIDAFFSGQGVPEVLRGPLKTILGKGGIENLVDKGEDALYPATLWTFRMVYSAPIGVLSAFLLVVAVLTVGVQVCWVNEYRIAATELSGFEFVRRLLGFGMSGVYVHVVPVVYLVIALIVASPFTGLRRRERDGRWTWGQPTKPEDPKPGDNPPGMTLEAYRVQVLREFEDDEDEWRRAYRNSLIMRAGVMIWSMSMAPVIIMVIGMVTAIPTFQYLVAIEYVVIGLIAGHLLWLPDDFVNALQQFGDHEHAEDDAGEDEHGKKRRPVTRFHRLTGTSMIIVLVAPITDYLTICTMPWVWSRPLLFIVYLVVSLAVILVSRILSGDSADSPLDMVKKLIGQRGFMMTVVPSILGFGGIGLLALVVVLSGSVRSYSWRQECRGYEETSECRWMGIGFVKFVDSEERWAAMRDRSAVELAARKRPVGDACVIASRAITEHEHDYAVTVLSRPEDTPKGGVCEALAEDTTLRARFPNWGRDCATQRVACGEKVTER